MPDRAAQIAALSLPLDQLPDPLPIPTIEKPFDVTIRPPGSKSITNRALLLAALADGVSELRGPLIDADDAQVMLRAIQQLGAKVEIIRSGTENPGGTGSSSASGAANSDTRTRADKPPVPPHSLPLDILRITGVNGRWKIPPGQTITLNLNNAGTATRFLTAAAILAPPDSGGIIIDGDARMRQRPIAELVDALRRLVGRSAGAGCISYESNEGFPPIHITATNPAEMAPSVRFGQTLSSQFISATLLIAPFLERGLTVQFESSQRITSESYLDMTMELLRRLGVRADDRRPTSIHVEPGPLKAFKLDIEPDATGSTYFWGAAALFPCSRLMVQGLIPTPRQPDLQGDMRFMEVLHSMGAVLQPPIGGVSVVGSPRVQPVDADLSNMPDTAMTAAVLACFASPSPDNPTATSTLRGLRTLRVKETDRLAALQTELTKLGATVEIIPESLNGQSDESLRITPPPTPSLPHSVTSSLPPLSFATYHDHRMAMSLALIGLRRANVLIQNPACVAKTYPTFWRDLARLY